MPSPNQLWHIYHVENCRHTKPDPKNKFVVIIHIDGDALGCFVNSMISQWLLNRPHLLVCEADLPGLNHRGLNHDSYVDCKDIYPFFDSELVSDRGEVSPEVKATILNAVLNCPTILLKHKKAILTRENWPPAPPITP